MPGRFAAFLLAFALAHQAVAAGPDSSPAPESWRSIITVEELMERLDDPLLLLIDARSAEEYAEGHLPGAISIPGSTWRTPAGPPGEPNQYVFRNEDGSPDIGRYEAFLGGHGVTRGHEIVVYGNHAGRGDGSIPVVLLHWLGHDNAAFLDGVGVEQWQRAGGELSTQPRSLPPAEFHAEPDPDWFWQLDDVRAWLADTADDRPIMLDNRSPGEYSGEDPRGNRHGGHVPGAIHFNYEDFLADDHTTVAPQRFLERLAEEGITPDRRVVLYCQTSTRISLPILLLRDLGFEKLSVYDAGWHEYGNLDDTPIATGQP